MISGDMDNTLGELLIVSSGNDYKEYVSRYRGHFFSGYTDDLQDVKAAADERTKALEFSRDGMLRTLPEALFFDEEFLRDASDKDDFKEKSFDISQQREQLEVYFEAFDTILERRIIELHSEVDSIESDKEAFVIKSLFDIDIHRIRNASVRKLARLLLDGDKVKGNIDLIVFFVRSIIGTPTSCRKASRVLNDVKSLYYIELQFIIYIDNLTSEQYREKMREYEEFFWYLEQWFLPYDCEVDFCIKDLHQLFILGNQMTLDYNTRL